MKFWVGWHNPPVELLVLSACPTALGDEEAELGFAGFAVQAGVKSVLASLWYVSDTGTLGLMTAFYEQLKQAPIKAEALRQTQLAMLKGQVRIQQGQLFTPGLEEGLPLLSCHAFNLLVEAAGVQGRGFERFYPVFRICSLNAHQLTRIDCRGKRRFISSLLLGGFHDDW